MIMISGCSGAQLSTGDRTPAASDDDAAEYEYTDELEKIDEFVRALEAQEPSLTEESESLGAAEATDDKATELMNKRWGVAPVASDEICRSFDPRKTDPRKFDLRTLVHYRQLEPTESDPFGDYTLVNEFAIMAREKIRRARRQRDLYKFAQYANRNHPNRARAEACLKIPPTQPAIASQVEPYQPNRLTETFEAIGASQPHNMRVFLPGEVNPFREEAFERMLFQVMYEESLGSDPIRPIVHKNFKKWSPAFLKKHSARFLGLPLVASKLLIALANGDTGRALYTGKEPELEAWIMAQPNRSVMPDGLFRKAYRLHRGDVYLTLLLLENVMSRYRFYPGRDYLEFTNRLGPILNHLGEGIDLFGPYYHFFGTLLYGYVEGRFMGTLAGRVEKLNSIFSRESSEIQEGFANVSGGRIGGRFRRHVKKWRPENWKNDPSAVLPDSYLDRSEDFRERLRGLLEKHAK